jgi:hypothetical protein
MTFWQTIENTTNSVWVELNKEINLFKDELNKMDKPDYSLTQEWNTITLVSTNEKDGNIKITIENGNLTFSHSTEWLISDWDLDLLEENEKTENEELNKINQVLKSYWMPLIKYENSSYLLLSINIIKNIN